MPNLPYQITLPKNSQFYVTIFKEKNADPSYILFGAIDNQGKHSTLAFLHKTCTIECVEERCGPNSNKKFQTISDFLHNRIPANLASELTHFRVWPSNTSEKISYKAFALTKEQYDEFIKALPTSHVLYKILDVYTPISHSSHTYILKNISSRSNSELENSIDDAIQSKSSNQFGINKTCRHTAIELLIQSLQNPDVARGIPTFALKKLPYQGEFRNLKMHGTFYILPIPPSRKQLEPDVYRRLSRIYKRMEKIPLRYTNHPATKEKFLALKELYTQLDPRTNSSLTNLVDAIQTWEEKNTVLIDQHRGFSLFKSTATRDMVEDLKKMTRPKKK